MIVWSSLAHNAEIFNGYVMTSDVVMVMDGTGGLHVFSELFCKSSVRLPYVLFFTVHPATLVSVNHLTFLKDGVSVLGVYQEVLHGATSYEMYFNTMFPAEVLAAFTHSFNTGQHYVRLVAAETCLIPGVAGIVVGSVGFLFCLLLVLFKAHTGYLHICSACLRRSSSLSNWLLEHTVFAQCFKLLITLNLVSRG